MVSPEYSAQAGENCPRLHDLSRQPGDENDGAASDPLAGHWKLLPRDLLLLTLPEGLLSKGSVKHARE